jgi:hypothetical protein
MKKQQFESAMPQIWNGIESNHVDIVFELWSRRAQKEFVRCICQHDIRFISSFFVKKENSPLNVTKMTET